MFNHEARAGMSRPKGREDFSATASRECDKSLWGPFATHPAGGAGSGAASGLADIPGFHGRFDACTATSISAGGGRRPRE